MTPRETERNATLDGLYRRYRDEILRFVIREGSTADDAEDIVQTAFLDAHQAIQSGVEPTQPRPWLYAIARNARLRGFRKRSARVQTVALDDDVRGGEADAGATRDLVDAIERLPSNQRSVWLLREVGGHRYDEIATRLGLTVDAVQMLLFRARRKLRTDLGYRILPLPAAQHFVSAWAETAATLRVAPLGGFVGLLGVLAAGAALGGAAGPAKTPPSQDVPQHRAPATTTTTTTATPTVAHTRRAVAPRHVEAPVAPAPARVAAVVPHAPPTPAPAPAPAETAAPANIASQPDPVAEQPRRVTTTPPPTTTTPATTAAPTTTASATTTTATPAATPTTTAPAEALPPLPVSPPVPAPVTAPVTAPVPVDVPSAPVPTTTVATSLVTLPQPPPLPPLPAPPVP